LFLRQTRNGAVLMLKGLEEEEVKEKMKDLPFYKLQKSIEYLNLILQF
jgi:muconolactone D-isomerase